MADVTTDDLLLRPSSSGEESVWKLLDTPTSMHPSQYLKKEPSLIEKVVNYKGIRPYATIKDLNNPDGEGEDKPKKTAIEIGIRGSF